MDNIRRFKDSPDVLDVSQVAALLRLSEKTVYKLIKQKDIKSIKIGRVYRIYKAELIKYISNPV